MKHDEREMIHEGHAGMFYIARRLYEYLITANHADSK